MAHRIEILIQPMEPYLSDMNSQVPHMVRNFIEALWVELSRRGWAASSELDNRVNSMRDFGFDFPARQSHQAVKLVEEQIALHMMERYVAFEHLKKRGPAGG